MEEEKSSPENDAQLRKTGVIPDKQLKGSDADKAYDENGSFSKQQESEGDEGTTSGNQQSSDADTDQQ